MALALDESKDSDESFEVEGFTFLLDKELNEQGSPFRVDLSYTGFVIDSKMEMGAGGECGSCSGSCG
ncbi:HesB/YadR/YfhF-family protein (fragment) [Maridesulfovibrio hydrothermalis AM13 = DSM 14728]|uniref:HesB/YadR/YfhF-family protein n=1 Tax=Maridesulfovibrio hydrothermalis AM13 = DSM 14728 TaxID=1121451 RepID=L0R8L4_9BACT